MRPYNIDVSSKWGAPMGRRDSRHKYEGAAYSVAHVPMVDGAYDKGGAYWGAGDRRIGWIYCAWHKDSAFYVRATDLHQARTKFSELGLKLKPTATMRAQHALAAAELKRLNGD